MDSLNLEFGRTDSVWRKEFDEWKEAGPIWQRLVTCESLILMDRANNRMKFRTTPDSPFFLEIRNRVWLNFEKLSPEEIKGVDEEVVKREFEKVVSSYPDLSEEIREVLSECLRETFQGRENAFRRVVGLNPIQGGEYGKEN